MATSQASQVSIRLRTDPLCQEQTEEAHRSRIAEVWQVEGGIEGISSQRLTSPLPRVSSTPGKRRPSKNPKGAFKEKGAG